MTYPYSSLPTPIDDTTNATPSTHSGHHNSVHGALNDLLTKLGSDPAPASDVTTRLAALDTTVAGKQASNANLTAEAGLVTAANRITTWTGSGTASLTDYTSDWLSQYPLSAGRGTTQTLIGGASGATSVIILQGSGDSAAAGGINLRSPTRLRDNGTETLTADPAPLLRIRQTRTLDFGGGASFGGGAAVTSTGLIANEAITKWNQSGNRFSSTFITNNGIFQNVTSVAANLGQISSFQSRPIIKADTAAITLAASADFFSRITLSTTGGGTLTPSGSGDLVGFEAALTIADSGVTWNPAAGSGWTGFATVPPSITGGTLSNFIGFRVGGGTGGSSTTTGVLVQALAGAGANIGIDIAAPTGGTSNIGIRSAGSILHTGSTGIGYTTGAGGTVTQGTSRATGVTLNKITGAITLFTTTGGSGAFSTFTVTNSTVAATDTIRLSQQTGTDKYILHVTHVGSSTFDITLATTGGNTSEAPVINFTVFKGATS